MINHGEKWSKAEEECLIANKDRYTWEKIAKDLGRSMVSCKERVKHIARIDGQKYWKMYYDEGMSDWPRCNPPSRVEMHDYHAYMAGYNDRDMGY